MFIRFFSGVVCLAGGLLFVAGCGGGGSTPASPDKSVTPSKDDHADHADHKDGDHKDGDHKDEKAHGHSHERGKMLIADAGTYHLLLTAHLAKGAMNSTSSSRRPSRKTRNRSRWALESFEAQATAGEGESQTLTFEPAPPEERPAGEKARTCSHFVAKAPWMKPEDELLVVAKFTVDGKELVARWKNFNPKKYAHHVE